MTAPLVVGISHKTAPVALRERLAIQEENILEILTDLIEVKKIFQEAVLLSTCNRTEIYGVPVPPHDNAATATRDYLNHRYGKVEHYLYEMSGFACIQHLFSVAAGLDSMVVGEAEILGQVKRAYLIAHGGKKTAKILNLTFQKSLQIGKHVRTHTGISRGATSVASVAVSLAERIFGNLSESRVLIVGAGKIAERTARNLISQKINKLIVTNRTHERAQALAHALNGEVIPLSSVPQVLQFVDIVITSTGSSQPIITRKHVETALPARRGHSLFFVDIAVPRDVEPDVHQLDNVYLYNIDDLNGIIHESRTRRQNDIEKARQMVHEKAKHFEASLNKETSNDRPLSSPAASPIEECASPPAETIRKKVSLS